MTHDIQQTTPQVWHKIPTGELKMTVKVQTPVISVYKLLLVHKTTRKHFYKQI